MFKYFILAVTSCPHYPVCNSLFQFVICRFPHFKIYILSIKKVPDKPARLKTYVLILYFKVNDLLNGKSAIKTPNYCGPKPQIGVQKQTAKNN